MKSKKTVENNPLMLEKLPKSKPKSLRPMRSMVAVRSLKPKTIVAGMMVKTEELNPRN